MSENIAAMLTVGGKSNSLGKVDAVIKLVLSEKSRLHELYTCLFDEDAWVRMRAADALEKVCRQRPDWLLPYVDRFLGEVARSNQPSIQWHLAQIYRQVSLTHEQKSCVINWLEGLLSARDIDWIVAASTMDTLAQFVHDGSVPKSKLIAMLKVQQQHKSKTVVKRANKLLAQLSQ